ncbi:Secologanin synthase [Triticum urartu]|uniref:Secologanin synthase n=1 Tax=Triticum urartu TaxID=4572 RepID=M8A7K5_TRIUA|nr:Secologanin synthase [Triticum urartu]
MDTIISTSTISRELSCTDRSSHAMVAMAPAAGLVLASLAVVLATTLWKAAVHLVWRPYAVARAFRRQGIRGPAYRFFVGNNEEVMAMRAATADDVLDLGSHDIIARVMPQYKAWVASYGKVFLSWSGYTPSLCVGDHDMLTADVISHTAFGSSYREGKEVFVAQRELQYIAFSTMNNAAAKEAKGYGNDLLGLMLEANSSAGAGGQKAAAISMDEIIDECKTFFFAGHDTTSHLLTWAIFLLGTHPEWQQKLREEVLRECGGTGTPLHGDALNKLKLTTMVLYETLRLYGAVIMIARETRADTELGGVKIPKGTTTMIPMAIMHRDEEVWGADAGEFKPDRFQNGVGRAAKHPSAMLAFSAGPRSCIGQDFAMLEAKATLAVILRRFEFEVAPEYVHAPAEFLTLQPKCGLPVLLKLLGQ